MFKEIMLTMPVLNATKVSEEVKQQTFDNLNDVYT